MGQGPPLRAVLTVQAAGGSVSPEGRAGHPALAGLCRGRLGLPSSTEGSPSSCLAALSMSPWGQGQGGVKGRVGPNNSRR